jgi:hypothetical protein
MSRAILHSSKGIGLLESGWGFDCGIPFFFFLDDLLVDSLSMCRSFTFEAFCRFALIQVCFPSRS